MPEWIEACDVDDVDEEDVIRFDHGDLLVALDGPRETYVARLADLMDEGKVEVVGE